MKPILIVPVNKTFFNNVEARVMIVAPSYLLLQQTDHCEKIDSNVPFLPHVVVSVSDGFNQRILRQDP